MAKGGENFRKFYADYQKGERKKSRGIASDNNASSGSKLSAPHLEEVEGAISRSASDEFVDKRAAIEQANANELQSEVDDRGDTEQEKAEIRAEKELYARLARVFPGKGEGGSTVSQEVLIWKFMESHPDSHKFLMYERDKHLAGEIFTFFNGSNFVNLLGLKSSKEKNEAKKLARKYLMDHGVGRWENFARKTADAGTDGIVNDLNEIRSPDASHGNIDTSPGSTFEDTPFKEDALHTQVVVHAASVDSDQGTPVAVHDQRDIGDGDKENLLSIGGRSFKNKEELQRFVWKLSDKEFFKFVDENEIFGYLDDRSMMRHLDLQRLYNNRVVADGPLLEVENEQESAGLQKPGVANGDAENNIQQYDGNMTEGAYGNSGIEEPEFAVTLDTLNESHKVHEEKENNPDHAVESLEELQERVDRLKNDADAARNLLFSYRKRNDGRWKRLKKHIASLREKNMPKPLVDEREVLETNWNYKLTLYKDARVELAKRKVAEEGSQGKDVGAVMAETIRELDFRGRVENYNAWKDAAWSGKKDSWLLRAVGRAKDWSESYRQLDWKKRAAISALVFGAGATGVAVGSVGLIGLGAASGTAIRLLGSYAAGRGLYEYLEGRANKNMVKFHEAALSHVEQSDDLGFLDRRTRDYADRMQKDFEQMTRKNRKRAWASAAAGALLFAGGTAFSLAHAASAAERVVESGSGGRVAQEALLAKGADVPGVPHADTTKEMLATAKKLAIEGQVKSVPVPSVTEVAVPVSDMSGPMPDSIGSGVIDHGPSAEIAGDIEKSLADMKIAAVPRGGSFGGVLIEKLMGVGVSKEDAGKLVHQAMLDLADKSGRPFEIFNHIQPGAEIQYEIGPDKSLSVFGVTREAGGEAIQRIADSTLEGGHASTVGQTIKESLPLSPKPADAVPVPSVQMPSPDPFPKMPEVNLESPQDIFERVLPKVPQAPSLEDTLSGNVSLDASVSAPSLEALPVEASAPVHDFESLDISVPGGEYLKNIGTVVKERLTFLPLSETQKDLIENIFSARIPTAGTEPTTSSVLFVRDALGKALFSSGDVERWMRVDIEQVRERVNKAVYAGLVRIGGESLRIKEMVAEGETVKGWLTKMARHILTHPIEPAK